MTKAADFAPGPSQLYFTLEDHTRRAFREGFPSISHRSKEFQHAYHRTVANLRQLLSVPEHFHIAFTTSASEVWERSIQSLVIESCLHLVNGAFSKKFYETALQQKKKATKIEVAPGKGFEPLVANSTPELIALTYNETSTGVAMPLAYVAEVRRQFPNSLIIVDAVSSVPYPAFNFDHIDSVFFSVQKGFGMPAGLGVWIYNNRCIEKAKEVQAAGVNAGSYHSLLSLHEFTLKNQTPATPNMLAIYTLGYVAEDFLNRGIHIIRKETEYKAALLYQTLQQHSWIKPFVAEVTWRSPTVIIAHCAEHTETVRQKLEVQGLFPGDGYGELKKTQLRFANFPAHSKEQYELLADALAGIK
ncbi:MAG: aminotransferase class V-fold PLP-dependent enzyme [Flammeovirgaceae bacterium]